MDSTSTLDFEWPDCEDYWEDEPELKWTDVYKDCEHCGWEGDIHWKRVRCPGCSAYFKDHKKKLKISYWNLERPNYIHYTEE